MTGTGASDHDPDRDATAPRRELREALDEFLSTPRPDAPTVDVLAVDAARRRVTLRLTFEADQAYCCFEPGCHLPLLEPDDWRRLRAAAARRGVSLAAEPLRIDVEGLVRAGARWDRGVNRSEYSDSQRFAEPSP